VVAMETCDALLKIEIPGNLNSTLLHMSYTVLILNWSSAEGRIMTAEAELHRFTCRTLNDSNGLFLPKRKKLSL
jgi:hypothetical protein